MFFKAHTLYFTGHTLRTLLEKSGYKVVAHNPDNLDNLSLLAQYVNSNNASPLSDTSHPLVSAQKARRWVPYLLRQLKDGQPVRKWRVHREEKQTAAQYADSLALLKDIYEMKS
jgi:hypothetical protein